MYTVNENIEMGLFFNCLNEYKKSINNKRDYVIRGWKRCIELGISPFERRVIKILKGQELNDILNKNKEFIDCARPYMENLYTFIKDRGYSVALTDENACIISIILSEKQFENMYKSIDFTVGAVWSIENVGNTAINTCLYEKMPIQITGEEHFCNFFKEWTCASSPIKRNGKIIGTLTLKGPSSITDNNILNMVTVVSKTIEKIMEFEYENKMLKIKNKYHNAVLECMSDGFLSIDNNGYLTYINDIGANMLGIKDKNNAIGKHIRDLVDFEPVILDVVNTGKSYLDKEFIITTNHGVKLHFIKSAMPIKDENGNIIGAIDTFRKIKRVHNMYRNIAGAYGKFTFDDIIGSSKSIKESIRLAKIAANSSSNVLIIGESGTGKELFVQSIHNASSRRNESFISINCAAIPSELIESELFGYESGAFTGALKNGQTGKFELANGGTLFLDEIGDMPLHMQAKLLRVLQENQFTRVGGNHIIQVDVRIIAATNKDLIEECKKGNFRRDLFYRLNVLNIMLPPLRERKEDIKELVDHFINKINKKIGKEIKGITFEALKILYDYDWPGNVRELENTIERAMNVCMTDFIDVNDLGISFINVMDNKKNIKKDMENINVESIEDIEKKAIINALILYNWNISKAARSLNMCRNTLYNKIKKYAIDVER